VDEFVILADRQEAGSFDLLGRQSMRLSRVNSIAQSSWMQQKMYFKLVDHAKD
jgi:hypothetical protein